MRMKCIVLQQEGAHPLGCQLGLSDVVFCFFVSSPAGESSAGRLLEAADDAAPFSIDATVADSVPSAGLAEPGTGLGFFLTTMPFIKDLTFLTGFAGTFLAVLEDEDPVLGGSTLIKAAFLAANRLTKVSDVLHSEGTLEGMMAHSLYSMISAFSICSFFLSASARSLAFSARKAISSLSRPRYWFPSFILLSHSSFFNSYRTCVSYRNLRHLLADEDIYSLYLIVDAIESSVDAHGSGATCDSPRTKSVHLEPALLPSSEGPALVCNMLSWAGLGLQNNTESCNEDVPRIRCLPFRVLTLFGLVYRRL